MNPYRLKNVFEYLTSNNQLLKKKLKLGTSEIPIPPKRSDVTTIEAINRFNKANPRVDTTSLKPLSVKHSNVRQSNVNEPNEGAIQSAFDTATRDAQFEGYPAPSYEKFKARYLKKNMKADGGSIGGGRITGTPIGDRTGFANIFLDQGKKSRFSKNSNTVVVNGKEYLKVSKKGDPNFGKYVYRTSVATPGYGKSGKSKNEYLTLTQLNKRVNNPRTGMAEFKGYSKEYTQSLEDIKSFVKSQGGAKGIYLADLVERFGDPTVSEDGRDATTEKRIKKALGDKDYEKLEKGADRKKITLTNKIAFNKLVKDVNRGDRPLIDLTQSKTGVSPNYFKKHLNLFTLNIYKKLSPKFKAIQSRILQPRQIYEGTNAINEIEEATTKTFNKIIKKYPQAQSARNVLTSGKGIVAYNGKTYVLSQLFRHVQNGGTKYKYVSGNTGATIKFRNTETGRMISLNNIDVNDPEFKEAVDAYNEKEKIMNTEIDDPRKKGAKIKIGQAIAANGDSIVIDHLDDVKNNPLKNLSITNQKANMAATIKGVTESELDSIGRGLKLNTEDNIKRYSNYAKRLLINKDNPDKIKTGPKETIFKKEGTLRGVTDPPDIEIKRLVAALGGGTCSVFSGTKSPALKADGGRIGLQAGTPNLDDCFKSGSAVINSGKVPVDKADDFAQLLKRAGNIGRGIMKFGIIPEALYATADSLVRVGMGDTFTEAGLRATDYLLPGDQTKTAEISKVSRIFGDETGELVGRTIDYKNQLAKIQSLEDQKANFENLSGGGEFDYIGDLSGDVNNVEKQLIQARNDLDNKFKISEAEQLFAESKQDDAYDASKATSFLSNLKRKYRDSSDNLSDVETLAAPEKTQMQLNLNMLPTAPREYMTATDDQIKKFVEQENATGSKLNAEEYINFRDQLKKDFMTKGPGVYGKEQVYGTQGTFGGEPVNMTNYQPSNRFAGFKLGMASGGIASLTKTIPPESGPTPHGLRYQYNNVKKI